jgi:Putative DNA-binding domain
MLATDLSTVDAAFLDEVCKEHWTESDTLEFKRELPGGSDKEKHELQKDVCALANADGGDIVFGIDEIDGKAGEIVPIGIGAVDAEKRRIAQTLDSGIEPRLPALQIVDVMVPGGYVLVVRVPASFSGPHCVRKDTSRRFVMRNGTTTTDLSFDQLRSAFDRTATLGERARRFLADRTQLIADRKTPKRLQVGPTRVVHLIPLGGLAGRQSADLASLRGSEYTKFNETDWGSGSQSFNLDGVVVFQGGAPEGAHYGYCQIFRSGILEGASVAGCVQPPRGSEQERHIVWATDMAKFFRERTETFIAAAKKWGLVGPAILSYSLLNVGGYELETSSNSYSRRRKPESDRAHLAVPELWIDSPESVNIDQIVRPLLDTLWQGFGLERCLDFDAQTGEFKPQN